MEEGILSLKWNNHNSTFIHTLSTLHKMEMYSDVTLACEGKYFPVHKLVLSICSEYFEEILSRTKCQHPIVVLKDIKHNDLEALLNYMYAGEANVAQSELSNLIKAAECLRIKGLAVPDETPPIRDKRRHTDSSELPQYKKRRSEDVNEVDKLLKEYEATDNSRLLENSKTVISQIPEDSVLESQVERQNNLEQIKDIHKRIPEIILESEPVEVKQEVAEPKIEEHEDSHHTIENPSLELDYNMNLGPEAPDENERHGQETQATHIMQDLMSQSVPGPSGVQGHEAVGTWEATSNNLPGYSVDSYSSDEGRNPQQMELVLGRGTTTASSTGTAPLPLPPTAVLECPYCPRAFLYRSDLTRHLRSHTGEKPFTCPFCAYRGTQKTHLHEHIKRKHKALFVEHPDVHGTGTFISATPTILHLPMVREENASPISPTAIDQPHTQEQQNAEEQP